jgi:hypothetical protein
MSWMLITAMLNVITSYSTICYIILCSKWKFNLFCSEWSRCHRSRNCKCSHSFHRIQKSTFPHWSSYSLKYSINKKNQHYRKYNELKSCRHYGVFSYYWRLVKTTIKRDRLRWRKSIDGSLKTKPKDCWKYACKLKKNDQVVNPLRNDKNVVTCWVWHATNNSTWVSDSVNL